MQQKKILKSNPALTLILTKTTTLIATFLLNHSNHKFLWIHYFPFLKMMKETQCSRMRSANWFPGWTYPEFPWSLSTFWSHLDCLKWLWSLPPNNTAPWSLLDNVLISHSEQWNLQKPLTLSRLLLKKKWNKENCMAHRFMKSWKDFHTCVWSSVNGKFYQSALSSQMTEQLSLGCTLSSKTNLYQLPSKKLL